MPEWFSASLPAWLEAVGTIGTLGVAVWGLLRELRIRREDTRDSQAAQARLITATTERGPLHGVVVEVTNHSDAPVFAVTVEGLRITPGEPHLVWSQEYGEPQRGEWPKLAPGETVECTVVCFDARGEMYMATEVDSFGAQIEYVDARGLRWRRVTGHAPERLTDQPITLPDHAPRLTKINDEIPDSKGWTGPAAP